MGFSSMHARAERAPLISVVSGSGGVGKSTVALISAWLAAKAGIGVALIEGDLQFGDYGYWMGLEEDVPSLAAGESAEPIYLADGLALFKAPCFPETAEDISDEVAQLVRRIRDEYGLIIADTGQFWSGLVADLVYNADFVFDVMDVRPASVMSAVRALELCARIGVPASRCVAVYNRYSGKARLSLQEVEKSLSIGKVHGICEGRAVVDALLCSGSVEELVASGNSMVADIDNMLADVLPRTGLLYAGTSLRPARRLMR